MGYLIGARGYVMIGIGGFLVGFMFFLLAYRIYLVAVIIGIIGFLIAQVGFGFILTTEKSIDRMLKKNTSVIQRIFGRIPNKVLEEITEYHKDIAQGSKARDGRGAMFVGIFSIIAAILIFVWREQAGYPLLLFLSGIIFFYMGYRMGTLAKKKGKISGQTEENPRART